MDFTDSLIASPLPVSVDFTYNPETGIGSIDISFLWQLFFYILFLVLSYKIMMFFVLPALKRTTILPILLLTFGIFNFSGITYASDTTWVYPATAGTINANGSTDWLNINNAKSNDGILANSNSAGLTYYLYTSNYLFNIPTGSIINGIKIKFARKSETEYNSETISVKLVDNNGGLTNTNKSTNPIWTETLTDEFYGSESDLWGLNLTPEILNDSDFGLAIQCNSETGGQCYIDSMAIQVFYTEPTPEPTPTPTPEPTPTPTPYPSLIPMSGNGTILDLASYSIFYAVISGLLLSIPYFLVRLLYGLIFEKL